MPKLAILLALTLALILVSALIAAPPGDTPKSIQLKDQFGKQHQISFPRQTMTLLTIADDKGAAALEPWLAGLKKRYGTNVHYVGIAQVRSVPSPLRSFVTSRFKKKYSYPILLDWSGDVVKPFAPQAAAPNIYLLSKTGSIVHQAHGPLSERALNSFPIPD
ncbi:MAG TPA: hypothetical protein VF773_03375 [Verrucomicrobiae bacterium]